MCIRDRGHTVLDNTMGSGSTGIACINTNRKFIGIELENKYYSLAFDRIKNHIDSIKEKKQEEEEQEEEQPQEL